MWRSRYIHEIPISRTLGNRGEDLGSSDRRNRIGDTVPAIFGYLDPKALYISLQKLRCRSFDDLESEIGGFAFGIVNLQFAVLSVVKLRSSVDECHAIAQHAIDQSSQLGSHGLNGNGSPELGSQSAKLRSEIGIA